MALPARFKKPITALAVVSILLALETDVVAKKIDGDSLLQPDRLVDIRISLPAADWEKLCQQGRNPGAFFSGAAIENPYTYFKADIWIDDVKVRSVGVRKKGLFGSLDNTRPSLKIKFDEFEDQDPLKGLSRLTLNNNKQDTSQVSQFLTYKLFRDAGVHAPRCNLARVTVNDEYLGIYTNVESIKKPFLSRSFGDKSGILYEGTLTDFHPKTVEKLEAKTNEAREDRTVITRLAELLAAEGELQVDELEQIIDVDNFLRYWALEGIIRFWDGYASNQNNYYFYIHPKNDRGYFIPWGADASFTKGGGPFAFFNQGSTAIYAQSILANRLYKANGVPDRYRATVLTLLDEVWNEQELVAEIDRIEQLISSHLHENQQNAPDAMDQVRDFVKTRREALEDELAEWPAEVPAEPRKPMYTVAVGKAGGSFTTVWSEQPPADPTKAGSAEIQIKLGDDAVSFDELGVSAQTFQFPRFGPGGGGRRGAGPRGTGPPANFQPPVNLVFTGIRSSDGERVTVSLFVDRRAFQNEKNEPISVTGRLTEGAGRGFGFGFGGGANKSLNGELRIVKSGTNAGDAVVGDIKLDIVEVHGGFFGQRRPPRGQRGPEIRRPGEGPRPRRPQRSAEDKK
jgi:hypothetical protein